MNQTPTVSGIMIFLNAERFIEEAIESVLNQSYQAWELLLVDDGSTDKSSSIAQNYTKKYPNRIRYLEHENHQNKGMSASRNLGIRHAKGQYIAFIDADDVWLSHKLEQQVPLLESQPQAAMLYGRTQYWFSWTEKNEDQKRDCLTKLQVKGGSLVPPSLPLLFYLKDEQIYPCTCSVLIRHEVFEEIGTFEESFQNANEDMVFYTKIFLKASVFISDQCWDRYRINPDSYWVNYWKRIREGSWFPHLNQPHPERQKYLQWLMSYLDKEGIDDPVIWKAIGKAFWPYKYPELYNLSAPFRFFYWKAKMVARKMIATFPG